MNLPNKITMLRVFLIPFFVVFMLVSAIPYSKYIALVIFVVASLTDTLDGYIARKYKLVSNFGKFMDPLADKLLVSSAMICLVSLCSFRYSFVAVKNAPLPMTLSFLSFGVVFSPGHFRRRTSRLVSYYALFE